MRCIIRDILQYALVHDYHIRCSKKQKSYTIKLKFEAGKPGGSNRSRVSNTSGSLIVAGGLTALFF